MPIITAQNNLESGLAPNTAFTAGSGGNTGGSAGAFFPNVYASSGSNVQYSSTSYSGDLSANTRLTASVGATFGWRPSGNPTSLYFRAYFRLSSLHTGTLYLVDIRDNATSASGFSIRISSSGLLSVYKRSVTASTLTTAADPLLVNTWYRIEGHVTADGSYELRVYTGDSLIQFTPALSGNGVATGLSFYDYLNFGVQVTSGTATLDAYYDNLAYSTTGWIGPISSTSAKPLDTISAAGFTHTGRPTFHETTSDSSDSTYSRSPNLSSTPSTASVRLSELGSGNVKFQARLRASTPSGVTVVVRLFDNATLIAERTVNNVPATATTYDWTLTGGEEALISDRSNLRIEVAGTSA